MNLSFSIKFQHAVILIYLLILTGCTKPDEDSQQYYPKVAEAGNEVLTKNNLAEILINSTNKEDSLAFIKKSIEKWAMDALLYQEALSKLEPTEIDIEKQVLEYRKQLINHIYESKLIENNLDTVVKNTEIEKYYNEHIDNFILRDNIVKVNYVKLPVQSKEIQRIKKLILASNEKEKQQLEILCTQHAESYFINDSIWLLTEEIKREIPSLKEQLDYNLYKGKVIEFSDNESYYFIKIKDVKTKNTASPIAFERENIKTFILNKRKIKLIENYKKQLLDKAKKENTFKIF